MSTLAADIVYPLVKGLVHSAWWSNTRGRQHLALRWLGWCAEHGHVPAQSQYGHLLYFRSQDEAARRRGLSFILSAAEAGDSKAQYQTATLFEAGAEGFESDQALALYWYERAAQAGNAQAIDRLIRAYSEGSLGCEVDALRLKHWRAQRLA